MDTEQPSYLYIVNSRIQFFCFNLQYEKMMMVLFQKMPKLENFNKHHMLNISNKYDKLRTN